MVLKDHKNNCLSISTTMKVSDYIELSQNAFENGGNISGQRDTLTKKTARTIRERMVHDIGLGTIFPPIVLGLTLEPNVMQELESGSKKIMSIESLCSDISIIDGMQRTSAIHEALSYGAKIHDNPMRVEFWVAEHVNSLIYRMLVLNTGQTPWNIRRQIEVVYKHLIDEVRSKVKKHEIEIIELADKEKRKKAGQYQASDIIELYLSFGSRDWKVNTKQKLADEFTRIDFIKVTEKNNFTEQFINAIILMGKFDIVIEKLAEVEGEDAGKFKSGKDLFTSQTSKVGFMTALGIKVIGRKGMPENEESHQTEIFERVQTNLLKLIYKLESGTIDLREFLDYATLNQVISDTSRSKIGDFERDFFTSAFKVLLEESSLLESMTPCWRA